jgi:hypothetical protein
MVPDGAPAGAERFLHELRRLRDLADLGLPELAARAHYPCDVLQAAETGPRLPDLPVLSAYVRGCGGAVAEWEERWRSLTSSPASSLLPTRTAGCSDAASAGARAGTATAAADNHDPGRIMAALDRVANGMAAAAGSAAAAAAAAAQPGQAVPSMRLPLTPDAAPPERADGTAPERADGTAPASASPKHADSRPAAAGTPPSAVSAANVLNAPTVLTVLTARRPADARHVRGTVSQRAVITALVAVVLLLVSAVLVFIR